MPGRGLQFWPFSVQIVPDQTSRYVPGNTRFIGFRKVLYRTLVHCTYTYSCGGRSCICRVYNYVCISAVLQRACIPSEVREHCERVVRRCANLSSDCELGHIAKIRQTISVRRAVGGHFERTAELGLSPEFDGLLMWIRRFAY